MKLRNKKTGEIGFIEHDLLTTDPLTGEMLLTVRYKDDSGINCYKDYATIKFFNEEWEDYTPSEPLIKDEKIRKAVRAWAEANEVERVAVLYHHSVWEASMTEISKIDNASLRSVFLGDLGIKRGYTTTDYTITELCGDEIE